MSKFWPDWGFAGKVEDAFQSTTDLVGGFFGGIGNQIAEGVQDIASGAGGILSDLILEPVAKGRQAEGFFGASAATAKELLGGIVEATGHSGQILFGAGEVITSPIGGIGWGNLGEALDAPYQNLIEPVASDWVLSLREAAGGSFRDGMSMSELLNVAAHGIGAGTAATGSAGNPLSGGQFNALQRQRSRAERKKYDYSLGQAVALLGSPDPRDREAMKAYQEGQVYRLVAGTGDVVFPVLLDPLNVVGVGASIRAARWGVKAGDDVTQLLASRRVSEVVDDMWGTVEHNPDQAPSLLRDKYFRNHEMGGEFSDLIGTSKSRDEVELVMRAGTGDLQALHALGTDDPVTGNAIRRMMGDQRLLRAQGWSSDPDTLLYTEGLDDLKREIDALYPVLERQNRLNYISGTLREIPHSSRYNTLRHNLTRTDAYQTKMGAPLRVTYQMRHHNFVVLDDPNGDAQVFRMLQKAPFTPEEQSVVHSRYLAARTPEAKAQLIQQTQNTAMERILTRYGYDTADKEEILRRSQDGRVDFQRAQQRYAADNKDAFTIVEDGKTHIVHKPLAATQHDQIEPLVRLADFDRMAKRYSPLEAKNAHLYETDLVTGKQVLSGKKTLPEQGFEIGDALLQDFQSLWKASVLLRPAYIARVPLGEEQLRIMALFGPLANLRYARSGVHNMREDRILLEELRDKATDDFAARMGRDPTTAEKRQIGKQVRREYKTNHRVRGFRDTEIVTRLNPEGYAGEAAFGPAGRADQQRVSTSAAWDATMGRDSSIVLKELERRYAKFHGTNNWRDNLAWTDEEGQAGDLQRANWTKALTDFTSRHIGTDEVYRKVLAQHLDNQTLLHPDRAVLREQASTFEEIRSLDRADDELLNAQNAEITEWLLSPQGAHYFRTLDGQLRNDMEGWLDRMRDVVETYLPTAVLKQKVLDKNLTLDDVTREFAEMPARPRVHGEEIAAQRADHPGREARKKFLDNMWKTIVQLPTEIASRNQVFNHAYGRERLRQVELLERRRSVAAPREDVFAPGRPDAQVYGPSPEEMAVIERKARQFALHTTRKKMYDMAEESDLSHTLRFVSPFFRAWQEVLTVWGGIAVENPVFVNQLRHVWETPDRAGITATDPGTGEEYIVLPVPKLIRDHMPADALRDVSQLKFSKRGFNTILTATPGTGPVVGVAVSELTKDNPETRSHRALQILNPFGVPDSGIEAVVSSTLIKNVTAFFDDDNTQRQNLVRNLYAAQLQDYYSGNRTSLPDWNEIQEQASSMLALRTVTNAILPTGAQFVTPFQPYIDTYRRLQEIDRETADEKFYEAYGPEFFSLVTSATKSNASIPPTIEAWKEYQKEGMADLIGRNPEYAALIVGEGAGSGAFNSEVFAWQLRTRIGGGSSKTIRERVDPEEAFKLQQADTGWLEWNRNSHLITDELTKRGLGSLQDRGAEDLKKLKNELVLQMSDKYPEWFKQFNVIDLGKWNRRAEDLGEIAYSPTLRSRPEIQELRNYLELREKIMAEMITRARQRGTSLVNANLKANFNSDLAQLWLTSREQMVERNPAFETLFHRYLERDTLGAEWEEAA